MAGLGLSDAVDAYYDAKDKKIARESKQLDLEKKKKLMALGDIAAKEAQEYLYPKETSQTETMPISTYAPPQQIQHPASGMRAPVQQPYQPDVMAGEGDPAPVARRRVAGLNFADGGPVDAADLGSGMVAGLPQPGMRDEGTYGEDGVPMPAGVVEQRTVTTKTPPRVDEYMRRTAPILMQIASIAYAEEPDKLAKMRDWVGSERRREQVAAVQELQTQLAVHPEGALPAIKRLYSTSLDGKTIDDKTSTYDPQKGIWSFNIVDEGTGKVVGQQKVGMESIMGMLPTLLGPEQQINFALQKTESERRNRATDEQILATKEARRLTGLQIDYAHEDRKDAIQLKGLQLKAMLEEQGLRRQAAKDDKDTKNELKARALAANSEKQFAEGVNSPIPLSGKSFDILTDEEKNRNLQLANWAYQIGRIQKNPDDGGLTALDGREAGAFIKSVVDGVAKGTGKVKIDPVADSKGIPSADYVSVSAGGRGFIVPKDHELVKMISDAAVKGKKKPTTKSSAGLKVDAAG